MMNGENMHAIVGLARHRALAHVINALAYENFLCECIRARVDFRSGNFLSVDPANRHFDQVENFAWGSGAGHDKKIARRLMKSLTLSPNRFMVIDDVMGDVSNTGPFSAVNNGQFITGLSGRMRTRKH